MLQKKNEGILFSAEIRVVGSYTDRLLMPWRHHICMAKWLYSYRDDLPKGLFKITAEECKKSRLPVDFSYFCARSPVVIRGETNSDVANSSVFSD